MSIVETLVGGATCYFLYILFVRSYFEARDELRQKKIRDAALDRHLATVDDRPIHTCRDISAPSYSEMVRRQRELLRQDLAQAEAEDRLAEARSSASA